MKSQGKSGKSFFDKANEPCKFTIEYNHENLGANDVMNGIIITCYQSIYYCRYFLSCFIEGIVKEHLN